MKTYILLIRGINVGGNNLLPMIELVSVLEKNHYQNIKTYLQTGNIVLESDKYPVNIGMLIEKKFGFNPDVIILDRNIFRKIVNENPFKTTIGKHLHCYFCGNIPKPDIEKIDTLKSTTEEYCLVGKVVYFYAPDGIGRSKLAAKMEKCLGVSATGRNLNTVNKLLEMIGNAD